MSTDLPTFKCVVIAPTGKLLDCVTESVILPAHDGQRGILRDHIPMFCQLGFGIMEVKADRAQSQTLQRNTYLLIDGGFALLAQNLLTVIAYDAVSVQNLTAEQIDQLLAEAQMCLSQKDIEPKQHRHELVKTKFFEKLVALQKSAANP
jgi:F0F1-type ATP synthase epsilon subunit